MSTARQPAVSVVIPLYNKEREVDRSLQSVREQTIPPEAVIVVDDGSTDGSAEVVRNFGDARFKLISQQNAGPSSARNRGIAESPTDLVALLDADDVWHPDLLETLLDLHARFPDAGMWCCNFEVIREEDGGLETYRFPSVPKTPEGGLIKDFFDSALKMPPLCCSGVILSRKVLDKVGGFPEGVRLGEDFDLWIRIAAQYPIAYTPLPKVRYHKDATNRAMNREHYASKDTCIYRQLKRILKKGEFPYTRRKSVAKLLGSHVLDISRHAYYVERNMPLCRELVREVWGYGVWRGRCIRRLRKSYMVDLRRILRGWRDGIFGARQ